MKTSTKPTHTPGPWYVSPMAKDIVYAKTDGKRDELCVTAYKRANGESEANARLIAACPTMFDYVQKKANQGDEDAQEILRIVQG